jgi:hypothetical protein
MGNGSREVGSCLIKGDGNGPVGDQVYGAYLPVDLVTSYPATEYRGASRVGGELDRSPVRKGRRAACRCTTKTWR